MSSRRWSWRNLTKKPLSHPEIFGIQRELDKMPDRAAALVAGALVDRALEHAILARMARLRRVRRIEIFDSPGPLSGFSAKIKVGYGLALYGEKGLKELDEIRVIRNAFAHSIHNVSFSTKRIKNRCMTLKSPNLVIPAILIMLGKASLHDKFDAPIELTSARDRYLYAATLFWILLESTEPNRPHRPRGRGAWTDVLIP